MTTHRKIDQRNEVFFVTFTCYKWIPLFEKTSIYDQFEKWFEYLKKNHVNVLGYVIMPNHFHGLFFVQEESQKTINSIIGNGKRFLAYEIVRRLKNTDEFNLLVKLESGVNKNEQRKGKKHQVFQPSFDVKICYNRTMVETKLEYIHHNPNNSKWNLASDWTKYAYSSASFYLRDEENHSYLKHYKDFI